MAVAGCDSALRPRLALIVAAGVIAGVPGASQPQSQFRSRTDLIRLDVSVLDRHRVPVRGLGLDDFTVLEDGRPVTVSTLAEVLVPDAIPATSAWMRDVDPDIRRNDRLNQSRLVVIVLDDAQVTSPNQRIANNVRAAGRAIVDRLGPADLCAVLYTQDSRNVQEFTTDRTKLLAAIDRFHPGMGGSVELFQRYTLNTLTRTAEYLAEVLDRRKAVFYISTGIGVSAEMAAVPRRAGAGGVGGDREGGAAFIVGRMLDLYQEAQIANVNFHAIDPSALEGGLEGVASNARRDFLIGLSENTGGSPIINRDDYQNEIDAVFAETASYYLLGYEPAGVDDGRFRRVSVKVNGRPELTVRSRSGYVAAKPLRSGLRQTEIEGPPPLWKAISGLLPVGDLPLQLTAAPFAMLGRNESTVAIVLGVVQDVAVGPEPTTEQIEILVDAFGQDGSSKSAHGLKGVVSLRPEVTGKVGYEVLSRIELKPGRYQLRVSAHLAARKLSGSVYYDVDVPDVSRAALAMSGAVLSVLPTVTAAPRDRLGDVLPIIPTTNRHFRKTDDVTAYAALYQSGRREPQTVDVSTQTIDANGRLVHERRSTVPAQLFKMPTGAPFLTQLPIAELAPGAYLLRMQATLAGIVVKREIRFFVGGS